ncbi:MAG: amidohydrolase [Oscillospiraceae bacterium]|nr:amidohydrolase [Oscillospiraceae bacterium]
MFIDVHAHVYKYQYPVENGEMLFITLEELTKKHDGLNIERAILLPIVSPEVYVPQSVGEIIDIADASGGRFIPYCNIDPRVYSNSSDAPIGRLLEYYKHLGCRGIGEVMPNLPWSDPRFQNLLRHVEQAGFPLIFDMTGNLGSGYGIYDDPGMPQLEACLEKFPDLLFVGHGPAFWAEISALRDPFDRFGYPNYPVAKEGRVPQLLREYPNLAAELSAGSGANALARDPEYAVSFLNEFKDKIMFGTDICTKNNTFPTARLLQDLQADGKIPGAFEMIARENAIRLLKI